MLEIVARVLDGRHPDRRIGPPEPRQRVREAVARDERRHPEAYFSASRLGAGGEGAAGIGHVVPDLPRMPQELVTGVRNLDTMRLALEERNPQVSLERLDRLGHRGLRDRQRFRCTRYAFMLGGRDEELKLSKSEGDCRAPLGSASRRVAGITARLRELGKMIEWLQDRPRRPGPLRASDCTAGALDQPSCST
jgi:hypothetical protein